MNDSKWILWLLELPIFQTCILLLHVLCCCQPHALLCQPQTVPVMSTSGSCPPSMAMTAASAESTTLILRCVDTDYECVFTSLTSPGGIPWWPEDKPSLHSGGREDECCWQHKDQSDLWLHLPEALLAGWNACGVQLPAGDQSKCWWFWGHYLTNNKTKYFRLHLSYKVRSEPKRMS